MAKVVRAGEVEVGGGGPLVLIAGPCVIESEDVTFEAAERIKEITERLEMPFIFKSSYLKDNRSSSNTYQGPGLEEGLRTLEEVRRRFDVPVLSDVHGVEQVDAAAEVLDVVQIPAYLCMQTRLALAVARKARAVNVKKGQFLDPEDVGHILRKLEGEGCTDIIITERGSMFGYRNLVVDMRSFPILGNLGYPVVFDVTHAVRVYGIPSSDPNGGRPEFVPALARAGVAAGCDAVFIETHPRVGEALCDASSMWPLEKLERLLVQLVDLHGRVREYEEAETEEAETEVAEAMA